MIRYFYLKKLPTCHHFLATLFSKILYKDHSAPAAWCTATLRLIHKGGETTTPSNFRPIALTSIVGKIFHKIIAIRLEKYLLNNNMIDSSIQKGFLTGVMEHILSLNAIMENAKHYNKSLYITFLDLKNAFGSVPHNLIEDMLVHIRTPTAIVDYIKSMYLKLTASITTKSWSSPPFPIRTGVFQGDTFHQFCFYFVSTLF